MGYGVGATAASFVVLVPREHLAEDLARPRDLPVVDGLLNEVDDPLRSLSAAERVRNADDVYPGRNGGLLMNSNGG
jgi:hypothetical protein